VEGNAEFYMQFSCGFYEQDLKKQQNIGLFIAFTGVITCILFRSFVYWLRIMSDIDLKVWDVNNITIADFSV
jgi:hypothetical protein